MCIRDSDIRSPLSILRGYQEMLLEFVSAESIKTEDVIDILQTGDVYKRQALL